MLLELIGLPQPEMFKSFPRVEPKGIPNHILVVGCIGTKRPSELVPKGFNLFLAYFSLLQSMLVCVPKWTVTYRDIRIYATSQSLRIGL
ncbi:hypothetical protein AQ768_01695 [Burkholderia pseudomallei]|nr:hypothetical protein AQ768_01695 [Burkholderia pseudomallei]